MIRENIGRIRQQIGAACSRAGRDPAEITVIAVTKGRSVTEIKQALDNGLPDIGENRVQEAAAKHQSLAAAAATWHLIGHLQTNKAKEAVGMFDLIHSVDSLRLAEEIGRQAAKINKVQDILVEVNVSGEASKFGIKPGEAAGLIREISGLKNIRVRGLMTIAPLADDPEKARPHFKALRELRDKIGGLEILSMGMTDDFGVAIEEGANMIRLGRAIFDGHP